jgi:hypothetical protein
VTSTDFLGLGAFLLLPLFGIAVWRLEGVRRLDVGGRLAIAGAAGAVIVPIVLALLTIARIPWSRTTVFAALAVVVAASLLCIRGARAVPHAKTSRAALVAIAVIAVLFGYGLLTARMSSGDLHFFWGPKGILYFHNGGVTLTVLKSTLHRYMNPDYPLLLPLLNSWSLTVSRQFAWWGSLLAAGAFLLGSVGVIRSTSGDDSAAVFAAATLGYAAAKSYVPGGAEPVLLLFETVSLCALTLIEDDRTQKILCAIGLAGAAATKIEGATFAIAVVLALLLVKRDVKRAVFVGTPAALIIAGWMLFLKTYDLSIVYHGASMPVYFAAVPTTLLEILKVSAYGIYWIPWLVAIALIVTGAPRRSALPIAVAILTLGATVFYYIHVPDPTLWILASGPRVLLTPLCCVLIAVAAARPTLPRQLGAVC